MKPPVVEALQVQPTLKVDNPGAPHPILQECSLVISKYFWRWQEHPMPGNSVFFMIENADALYAFHKSNGTSITEPIADREYGVRDYTVRDPYGNDLVFGHYIYNMEPPIEIERVDMPVRLEKRLVALLEDLAVHKGMSVSSCLEEMLLHSFEPYGNSVASPHTKTTLRYIKELKEKYHIDYDSHGSYRFVEKP